MASRSCSSIACINVILLSATALVWFRMWGLRILSTAGAGVLILLNFRPMTDTIAFGQIDLALLLALTLALWALRELMRDLLAGALVALGTLFKVYPLLLLAFFVVKRRWWALAGFALGMLVLNGLSISVIGWEMHRVYLFEVLPRIGGTTSWVENQTISGFLARLVVLADRYDDLPQPADRAARPGARRLRSGCWPASWRCGRPARPAQASRCNTARLRW